MNYFVITLTYQADLTIIDKYRDAHLAFLKVQYDKGHFLVSGPQVPRKGGVILAQHSSMLGLEAILQQDPFAVHQLAHYEITEFKPTMRADFISA